VNNLDRARKKVLAEAPAARRNGGSVDSFPFPSPIKQETETNSEGPQFPSLKVWADLKGNGTADWLWHGCLARGEVTLFSALWKAGKTTLLAHLLKALEHGGEFCGLACKPARVLYVSEESEGRWAARGLALGRPGNVAFLLRPFRGKPTFSEWIAFLNHVAAERERWRADAVILDTISHLWPVRKENDAAEVAEALMPMQDRLASHAAVMPVHHFGKAGGLEFTGSRGSGEITAFADTILELRRYDATSHTDRRRVLTGKGRWDDTPAELVVELNEDGSGYTARGDKGAVKRKEQTDEVAALLPVDGPGMTAEEVKSKWEGGPAERKVRELLEAGAREGRFRQEGEGKKGDPYRYWSRDGYVNPEATADDLRDPFPQ
jgi:hypothetical protein